MAALARESSFEDEVEVLCRTIEADLKLTPSFKLGSKADMPSGWLLKRGESKAFLSSSAFKKRFVVLEAQRTLTYYADDTGKKASKGSVDLASVTAVNARKDEGKNTIELVTGQRTWVFASENSGEYTRWVALLKFCAEKNRKEGVPAKAAAPSRRMSAVKLSDLSSKIGSFISGKITDQNDMEIPEPPGTIPQSEYSLTFPHGPLGVRLEADDDEMIMVKGFVRGEDGEPGLGESEGKIEAGDLLIAVNGVDLTTMSFKDGVETIISTSWPKILHFRRPAREPEPDAGGWMFKQGENSSIRRRYFKLFGTNLFYYKPSILDSNAPFSRPAGYILLDAVTKITVSSSTLRPHNEQHQLELHTPNRRWVLSVATNSELEKWKTVFAQCRPAAPITINTEDVTANSDEATGKFSAWAEDKVIKSGQLRRKSAFTNTFLPRLVLLCETGFLFKKQANDDAGLTLPLTALSAVYASEILDEKYVIILATATDEHMLACDSNAEMTTWLQALTQTVSDASLSGKVAISAAMTAEGQGGGRLRTLTEDQMEMKEEQDIDVDALWENMQAQTETSAASGEEVVEHKLPHGFLWKRGDVGRFKLPASSTGSEVPSAYSQFKKRWFELDHHELNYYKARVEGPGPHPKSGLIDMRKALDVTVSSLSGCPANAIDIHTSSRVYTLVTSSDDEYTFWFEKLSNAADIYGAEAKEAAMADEQARALEAAERAKIREATLGSIVKRGFLEKRGQVRKTFKSRYFCLFKDGSLTYYASEDDVTSEDGEAIGSISTASISDAFAPMADCGSKKFTFSLVTVQREWALAAASAEEVCAWIEAICECTGHLKMTVGEDGRGITTVNEKKSIQNSLGYYGGKNKKNKKKKKKIGGGRRRKSVAKDS